MILKESTIRIQVTKQKELMLKLYRLKPKVGQRKELSATSVKNEMYKSALGKKD